MTEHAAIRHLTLKRQIWLGASATALMAGGVAIALHALQIEGALHERYSDALSLAEKSLQAQQVAADLRRGQARFASRIVDTGPESKAATEAMRAMRQSRAALGGLVLQLRGYDVAPKGAQQVDRIEQALAALAQSNTDLVARLREIEPALARDALLSGAEHLFAEIDDALADLVAAARERMEQMSQQAREYGALARRSLIAVSAIALVLVLLLGYVGWRAVRANARLLDQLSQLAHEDGLTGAVNRRGLDERMPVELARARRIGYPLTTVMIDLDHFKRFNDRRGHAAGDGLLRGAVTAWKTHLRPMDMLSRYGGEEFTLVLPNCVADQAIELINRLRPLVPDRQTFSAGVATWNGNDPAEELLREADAALLQAKKTGRNRTIVWGREPQITLPLRMPS